MLEIKSINRNYCGNLKDNFNYVEKKLKLFSKKCGIQSNCKITENNGQIVKDIKKKILKKAAIYEKEFIKKNKKKYLGKIR